MKRKSVYIFAFFILNACLNIALFTNKVNAQEKNVTVSLQVFYDQLSPYGQWIEDPIYGYVWMPDADEDFRPYFTNGHWFMTEYGNTWVSSYPWGWAPFHYGRWVYNSYYGWLWVPGYEWGPAWVCWRHGSRHYGWAPLAPWFTVTIAFDNYDCPANWWVFIPEKHIYRHRHSYRLRHNDFLPRTTIINHTYTGNGARTPYITGPKADEVYTATGKEVPVYSIENKLQPGASVLRDNVLQVYRPGVSFVIQERLKPTPAKIMRSLEPIDDKHPVPVSEDRKQLLRSETPRNMPVMPKEQRIDSQHIPTPRQQPAQRQPANIPARQPQPQPQPQRPAIDQPRRIQQPRQQVRPAQATPREAKPKTQQGTQDKR